MVFSSFRTHELLCPNYDSERLALAKRRLLRNLAPQTSENPIFFHFTLNDSHNFRLIIDQLAEVGFEMLIYSFGSGMNIETVDVEALKADIEYANAKGIEVGAYDLIALTR